MKLAKQSWAAETLCLLAAMGMVAFGVVEAMGIEADQAWSAEMVAKRASFVAGGKVKESAWFTTGPLKAKSFSDALFPVTELEGAAAKGGSIPAIDVGALEGQKPKWQKVDYANGAVHLISADDATSTFFYRTLVAEAAGDLTIGLGSDDGLEFWFNGKKLVSKDVPRGPAPDQDVVHVSLQPGTNTVLMKIYNRTGGCGFYYSSGNSIAEIAAGIAQRFPSQTRLFSKNIKVEDWFRNSDNTRLEQEAMASLMKHLQDAGAQREKRDALVKAQAPASNPEWLGALMSLAVQVETFENALAELNALDVEPLKRAVADLAKSFPDTYKGADEYLKAIAAFEKNRPALKETLTRGDRNGLTALTKYHEMERQALLANPVLDFQDILLVKRREGNLALPQNWQGNSSVDPHTENEIARMPVKASNPPIQTVYKPSNNVFVGDVDLHFNADRMLFSSIGTHNHWQVFEVKVDGAGLRQVSPADEPDIDSYDPMYLPNGRIIFDSTSTFQGVPCVSGSDYVANLHVMNEDGTKIRRLCFDQDNDWCPVLLPTGRVMYLRWEYTDSAHYFSRVLMSMNPDGTGQMEMYGSNSYWPNSLFYARPIPGSASLIVGIVTGHHGVARMGEMVIFDTSKGRQEDTGAIQRIPGYGKPVKGIIKDTLVDNSWPKFLHPYPLSDKYFLVSCKPTPSSAWGIYLVDIFDNMLLLREEPGYALFEPVPLRKTTPPPVISDKVNLADTNATVYVHDIYNGPGLKDVPRGAVKNLRLYQYEYSYRNQGGHYFVGMEAGWDVRRLIGTVPVEPDGSAMFKIPANIPVVLQPMDEEGKAMQLMRTWFVGMPGEYVSCVGCHERQNSAAPAKLGTAAHKKPEMPKAWYGPKRGFSFLREVQPVLDQYCAGCHKGQPGRPNLADPTIVPTSGGISPLPASYLALHPYVRRNGPEGDYHTLTPLEFHANTSLLVQMLRKGHNNVKLDAESWDRLITWIDINVPAYGTFHEIAKIPSNFEQRRYECKVKYANVAEDIEAIPNPERKQVAFVQPAPMPPKPAPVTLPGWPFDNARAKEMQAALGAMEQKIDLGGGEVLVLKRIPAGEFAMGDVEGDANEYPMARARVEHPFWMGSTEISLKQFQQFDPSHRNGYYDKHYKDQVNPGYLMDDPQFPAIRISWNQAMEFCKWLSQRTGKKVTLPSEVQWEWACRAGAASPMFYGDLNSDFSKHANLADATRSKLAVSGIDPQPIDNPDQFWDYELKEPRFNDGVLHLATVGHYQPNVWGLYDMIGNVAEWTLDDYRSNPSEITVAPGKSTSEADKVLRGGSWAERPRQSRASSRLNYAPWQHVYNAGFRVVVED